MVIFSVLYPAAEGARFDQAYYDATHVPLVREAFAATGLVDVKVFRGVGDGTGGPAPYVLMAHLSFDSPASLQASLTGPRGGEVLADVAKFTDIRPVTQVSVPG